ncbi:flavodoxin family protein [Clostridium sp. WILCCON 0269]|uniref:Flavodoxin family protein n=1 Tax=Candidatus Clostridium eludens TaxID=3381663 RepID=A0ABW8SKA7_9CLOT
MKITVITGSPHKNGTSALLADKFIEGAQEAGNDVFRFNSAFENVNACLDCDYCMMGSRPCVHDDSMNKLNPKLLTANLVVLVTPLYYFGMSAQLKTVIDRFYANNYKLMGSHKKAMLMATSYDAYEWTMKELASHYKTIVKYLKWEDTGILLATGVGTRSDIERTDYPEQAYRMGKNLK